MYLLLLVSVCMPGHIHGVHVCNNYCLVFTHFHLITVNMGLLGHALQDTFPVCCTPCIPVNICIVRAYITIAAGIFSNCIVNGACLHIQQ